MLVLIKIMAILFVAATTKLYCLWPFTHQLQYLTKIYPLHANAVFGSDSRSLTSQVYSTPSYPELMLATAFSQMLLFCLLSYKFKQATHNEKMEWTACIFLLLFFHFRVLW